MEFGLRNKMDENCFVEWWGVFNTVWVVLAVLIGVFIGKSVQKRK